MTYLVDTNVVSETRKRRPDPGVVSWLRQVPSHQIFLSVISVGELLRGVESLGRRDAAQGAVMRAWVSSLVSRHAASILEVTLPIVQQWALLGVTHPVPTADALIAATAIHHDLVVVTRNVKDFERTGARVVDPFSG